MSFGERLKATRESAGITQAKLSDISGVGRSSIQNYEAGVRIKPNKDALEKLAAALNVDPEWLLNGDVYKPSMLDKLLDGFVEDGTITSPDLDDATREIILKIVEAELINKLKNKNKL